jgi:hypothetical protein
MGATISTLTSILKELYLGPVTEQLNNDVLPLQRWDRSSAELVGLQAVVPLHSGRSGSYGARPENGTLPTATNQQYKRAVYDLTYHYGTIEITGPAIAKSKNDAGAFLRGLEGEMEGILNDVKIEIARQFYGDGTGRVATCGVTGASTTVVLSSAEAIIKGHLYPGKVIDIGTLANPVSVASARTVQSVNEAGPSIVISGAAVTTAGTDFIFTTGDAAASSVSYEMQGLQSMVPTAANTFGGINAATDSFWDNLRDNSTTSLTLQQLQRADNRVRLNGGQPTVKIGSFGVQLQYFNLLQSQVRYVEPMNLKSGFQTLEHNGIPVVADRHAPFGNLFVLDESRIKVFDNEDWHWLDEDGDILKQVPNKDAWGATLARYMQLGTDRRNVQMRIYGLTDAGY